jgi:hypothetical protein
MARSHRLMAQLASAPMIPLILTSDLQAPTVVPGVTDAATAAATALATAKHALAPPPPLMGLPANIHLLSLDRVGLETSPQAKARRVLLRSVQLLVDVGVRDVSWWRPAK